MAQQLINVGAVANDRTGDTWRDAFIKVNANETEIFTRLDAVGFVFITEESSFPVQDATTITLEAATVYIVSASFSTAKRFVCEDGSKLTAFNQLGVVVTYTGSGVMFTGLDASFTASEIKVNCAGGQIFDFDETVGGTKLVIIRSFTCISCAKFGDFGDLQTVLIEASDCVDAANGISFTGSNLLIASFSKFALVSSSASFVGVDFGVVLSSNIEMSNLILIAPAGAVGLSGAAGSANVPAGAIATVTTGQFAGGLTPLSGITSSDIRWIFAGNQGIPNSRNDADVFLVGGAETITTGSAGDWQEIGVPTTGGVSWASDIAERFTVGADGVMTYIGEADIDVRVSGRATVSKSGGGSDILEVRLAKNWTGVASDGGLEKSRAQTENATPTTVPVGALIALSTGDDIRAIFSNTNGASNIIANVSALEVSGQ